jgi:hypothetical protein
MEPRIIGLYSAGARTNIPVRALFSGPIFVSITMLSGPVGQKCPLSFLYPLGRRTQDPCFCPLR